MKKLLLVVSLMMCGAAYADTVNIGDTGVSNALNQFTTTPGSTLFVSGSGDTVNLTQLEERIRQLERKVAGVQKQITILHAKAEWQ